MQQTGCGFMTLTQLLRLLKFCTHRLIPAKIDIIVAMDKETSRSQAIWRCPLAHGEKCDR